MDVKQLKRYILAVLIGFDFCLNIAELGSPYWKVFYIGYEGLFRSCSFSVCVSYTGNIAGGFAAFFLMISLLGLIVSGYYVIISLYEQCVLWHRLIAYTTCASGALHFLALFTYMCGNVHIMYSFSSGFYTALFNMFLIFGSCFLSWKCSESTEPPLREYKEKWDIFLKSAISRKNAIIMRIQRFIPTNT